MHCQANLINQFGLQRITIPGMVKFIDNVVDFFFVNVVVVVIVSVDTVGLVNVGIFKKEHIVGARFVLPESFSSRLSVVAVVVAVFRVDVVVRPEIGVADQVGETLSLKLESLHSLT